MVKNDVVAEPDTESEQIDVTRTDYAYWDHILTKTFGLSMNAGRPRGREASFVGTSNNLVGIETEQQADKVSKSGRRVRPQGHGPD